jgi:glucoamylase
MEARWSVGAKDGVGTALSEASNVWFTISHGILNEVFYPQVDTPSIRDLGLIVTDEQDYFSEEAKTVSKLDRLSPGIPAFELTNTSKDGRYVIKKRIISDPQRPVVLQSIVFTPQPKETKDYHLYVLLAPHLGDMGGNNNAWVGERNGIPLLLAERDGCFLALSSSARLSKLSAGFVGISDGWQDLSSHKQLTWQYEQARGGNTALTAEIDYSSGEFVLALGFAHTLDEAIDNALESLNRPFDEIVNQYQQGWQSWLADSITKLPPDSTPELMRVSLTTIKTHESKNPSGGLIAGLATPWGYAKGDEDKIGYHAIWTRDLVESAGGLLAAGDHQSVKSIIRQLKNTQQRDGHWPQNMWIDGTPYWNGIQMDETALPILLVNLCHSEDILNNDEIYEIWPMVRSAAGYLLRNGPVTQQDRWEEDPGYTPFTVSAEIAALLAAADIADYVGESTAASLMRDTADIWHDSIDSWLYATGTDWCSRFGVTGYYERVASVNQDQISRFQNYVHIKNVPADETLMRSVHLISPDALALVRFGLREANDPRITDTVKVIDELLKIDTSSGITWHRYNDDGYGEHADGSAFDGTGIGRGWPLLTGERAHFELVLGNRDYAEKLKTDMENFAGKGGLLPEQVWDSQPIPEYELEFGRPTGSAMPLAWAHGEYLKLLRSLQEGRIFDLPTQTVKRYLKDRTVSNLKAWRFNHKIRSLQPGKTLRIETLAPATLHWTTDDWHTIHDSSTIDSGLGLHFVDLKPDKPLPEHSTIKFTFYWHHSDVWENQDFCVECKSQ